MRPPAELFAFHRGGRSRAPLVGKPARIRVLEKRQLMIIVTYFIPPPRLLQASRRLAPFKNNQIQHKYTISTKSPPSHHSVPAVLIVLITRVLVCDCVVNSDLCFCFQFFRFSNQQWSCGTRSTHVSNIDTLPVWFLEISTMGRNTSGSSLYSFHAKHGCLWTRDSTVFMLCQRLSNVTRNKQRGGSFAGADESPALRIAAGVRVRVATGAKTLSCKVLRVLCSWIVRLMRFGRFLSI